VIDPPTHMGVKSRIALQVNRASGIQPLAAQIAQPWREAKPQQIKQGKEGLLPRWNKNLL
jgi:hypothetical protein